MEIEVMDIPESGGLDTITAYWRDDAPGKGSVTITVYGCAWTAWFGAMGGRTIKQFFRECDTYYLTGKLGITHLLHQRKRDHDYLGRIIDAIKLAASCGMKGDL